MLFVRLKQANNSVMAEAAPGRKLQFKAKSQSPAVTAMLVMDLGDPVVMPLPGVLIELSTYSPTFPAVALSLIIVAGYCPLVSPTPLSWSTFDPADPTDPTLMVLLVKVSVVAR